jgi:alkylation response protein AidB-like acyl-CoA dehydrogenase
MTNALAPARIEGVLAAAGGIGGAFDPAVLARLDEREEFPAAAHALLGRSGLARRYVPQRAGGALHGLDGLQAELRAVAGRDLTVAVAHGKTFLGAVSTWVAGTEGQCRALAGEIAAGSEVCWGLSERTGGSDLLAGRLAARRDGSGWLLDGEKWLINNGTRARFACVLARTRDAGGPRGFSLLLVDKDKLPAGRCRPLPKEPTHGIRGADISGFSLSGARVPSVALIGAEGSGFETVLKSMQLTRVVATALSLGAGDHAWRIAAGFIAGREVYRHRLVELPRVARAFADATAGLLLAEAVAIVTGRAAQTLSGELPVMSAVAKAFVPTTVQRAIDVFADLLGVRGFLSDFHEHGAFAKLERDHRIIGIFDGSTAVNRHLLAAAFPVLAATSEGGRCDQAGLAAAASHTAARPALEPAALTLVSSGGCSVVGALPMFADLAQARGEPDVTSAARALCAESARLHHRMRGCPASSVAALELVKRYELCFAGAACLALWLYNDNPADAVRVRAGLTAALRGLGIAVTTGLDVRDLLGTEVAPSWLNGTGS